MSTLNMQPCLGEVWGQGTNANVPLIFISTQSVASRADTHVAGQL